jgi:hypothetical protein
MGRSEITAGHAHCLVWCGPGALLRALGTDPFNHGREPAVLAWHQAHPPSQGPQSSAGLHGGRRRVAPNADVMPFCLWAHGHGIVSPGAKARSPRARSPQMRLIPPSIESTCPVTHVTAGSALATIHRAISLGLAMRPIGSDLVIPALRPVMASAGSPALTRTWVSTGPGATAFTRTPYRASSSAHEIVSDSTAALLAA